MMKYMSALAITTGLLLTSVGGALADQTTINPNRPSVTCGTTGALGSPGNAASAPGSAFNENPGGVAGSVYAGVPGTPSADNAQSANAFSGYDVACSKVPLP